VVLTLKGLAGMSQGYLGRITTVSETDFFQRRVPEERLRKIRSPALQRRGFPFSIDASSAKSASLSA